HFGSRSLGLEADADIHLWLYAEGKFVGPPGIGCLRRKSIVWRFLKLYADRSAFLVHAFAGADIEGYILPAPVVDEKFGGHKSFYGRIRVHIFFVAIAGHFFSLHPTLAILPAHGVFVHFVHSYLADSREHIHFLV